MTIQNELDEAYNRGWREGYAVGSGERAALATANSDLRSEIRELKEAISELADTLYGETL